MAPRPPTEQNKRPSARAKALARLKDPLLPRKLHRPDAAVSDGFSDTKRDRRQIRRSAFVSRVADSAASGGISKSKGKNGSLRRRRPGRKLVATLESLGDALGEIEAEVGADGAKAAADAEDAKSGKVRHKSLRSRPGALKRKEKVVRGEMERFGQSLAHLSTLPGGDSSGEATASHDGAQESPAAGATADPGMQVEDVTEAAPRAQEAPSAPPSNRWAALRGFISATMEQNPAFAGKS